MPTVVELAGSSPAMARQLASSHRAMSRGVPRTWHRPRPEGDRRIRLGDDELGLASQSGRDTHDIPGYGDLRSRDLRSDHPTAARM